MSRPSDPRDKPAPFAGADNEWAGLADAHFAEETARARLVRNAWRVYMAWAGLFLVAVLAVVYLADRRTRALSGELADLESEIAGAQKQLAELEQFRERAGTQIADLLRQSRGNLDSLEEQAAAYEDKLAAKADADTVVLKDELAALLESKAASEELAALQQELTAVLDGKAAVAAVYSKEQIDKALAGKAERGDVYLRSEVDKQLAAKAEADAAVTRTELERELARKADREKSVSKNVVYTREEVDGMIRDLRELLDAKADKSGTVSREEIEELIKKKGAPP